MMYRDNILRIVIVLGFLFLVWAAECHGAPKEITWEDLIPQLASDEDPTAALSDEEIEFVEWIMYLRESLPNKVDPVNQQLYDELNRALPELKKRGLDVDELLRTRKERGAKAVKKLDGQTVQLSGYLLPLDFSGTSISDFLLVPFVGACIHVPPPPPNQIVYADSKTPLLYNLDELFRPVSVTGKISVKSLTKNLFLVDGSSDIDIGYTMSVQSIADYVPPGPGEE